LRNGDLFLCDNDDTCKHIATSHIDHLSTVVIKKGERLRESSPLIVSTTQASEGSIAPPIQLAMTI